MESQSFSVTVGLPIALGLQEEDLLSPVLGGGGAMLATLPDTAGGCGPLEEVKEVKGAGKSTEVATGLDSEILLKSLTLEKDPLLACEVVRGGGAAVELYEVL